MTTQTTIFTPLFIAAFLLFVWNCWRRLSLVSYGSIPYRINNLAARFKDTITYAFAQRRVLAKPVGLIHFFIFWCFLVLVVANGEFILHGIFPAFSFHLLSENIRIPLLAIIDIVTLTTFLTITIAIIRRAIAPPYPEARTFEAFFILSLIGTLMVASMLMNAAMVVLGEYPATAFPISKLLVTWAASGNAQGLYQFSWWLHALALLLFMNLLPLSKHFHIITAIPNIFLRNLDHATVPQREVFELGQTFGADTVKGYSWKALLDAFSCTECGRCQNVCPAAQTHKPLNPRSLIHQFKNNLLENAKALKEQTPLTSLIGDSPCQVDHESIWACTTCGACIAACPVFIEQMPKLLPLRRHLVETEAVFPEELLNLFENIEGRSNPWGIAPSDRSKWASLLGDRSFKAGETEYLFYVGCSGSFDARAKQIALAIATLLDHAGVKWGLLGRDEKCCGDSPRRLGNEYLFELLAKENVTRFKELGVKRIVTLCPHCFSTLANDYRQYGLEAEVMHHGQLLQELLDAGKLTIPDESNQDMAALKTIYHDSCYLGRHNDIYTAPRAVIQAATGSAPEEFPKAKEEAFCCGAGGGRMWLEEFTGDRINRVRTNEALAMQAETICTACPYCMTMFEDGLKDIGADQVRVKDISELLAERICKNS